MTVDLLDEFAIREVLSRYCQFCDDGDFGPLADLFAPDGTFGYGGSKVAGREALLAYFREVQTPERRGKHLTTNAVITVDGDRAQASSDWLFLVYVDGVLTPKITGRYNDTFVRADDRWMIAERAVVPLAFPA